MFRAGSPVIYRKESHEEKVSRGSSRRPRRAAYVVHAPAQEKKLKKSRSEAGRRQPLQMSLWLAKEGNFYEKNGLSVEAISIPGSSLALQAMLAGDLPIIQLGGAASIQARASKPTLSLSPPSCASSLFSICRQLSGIRTKGQSVWHHSFRTLFQSGWVCFQSQGIGVKRYRDGPTGGPTEAITAMVAGKIDAAALSPPATLNARKFKLKELLDMSRLEARVSY